MGSISKPFGFCFAAVSLRVAKHILHRNIMGLSNRNVDLKISQESKYLLNPNAVRVVSWRKDLQIWFAVIVVVVIFHICYEGNIRRNRGFLYTITFTVACKILKFIFKNFWKHCSFESIHQNFIKSVSVNPYYMKQM